MGTLEMNEILANLALELVVEKPINAGKMVELQIRRGRRVLCPVYVYVYVPR